MSVPPLAGAVTGDELVQHRLKQLEEWRVDSAATVQSTVRDVDLLKLESATVKALLVEVRTEMRGSDEHTRASLARIHERLDELTTEDARDRGHEDGRMAGRAETLKLVGWTVMATIAFCGVVIGLLTLVLNL